MSNVAKVLSSAGNTQGIPDNSENLFATRVYNGNASSQTITNGVDLSGGGMVWVKTRSHSAGGAIVDTATGASKYLLTASQNAQVTGNSSITSFNTTGFDVGSSGTFNEGSGYQFASWSWKKAPNFFDVVTYTGTGPGSGANEQTVSHSLGVKPALIIIKKTSATGDWWVFTDKIDGTNDYAYLNSTNAFGNSSNNVATDSVFSVGGVLNGSGATYVAYLFASNDGAGTFGPDGNSDVIKVGTYNGSGGSSQQINVGFEVQWLMIKNASHSGDWAIFDMMRQFRRPNGQHSDSRVVYANKNDAEGGIARCFPQPEGFGFEQETGGTVNESGRTYLYMAIGREQATPTAGTEVFSIDAKNSSEPYFSTNDHIVDMGIAKDVGGSSNHYVYTRIWDQKYLPANSNNALLGASEAGYDFHDGYIHSDFGGSNSYSWMWKRARGFFDYITYVGTGSSTAFTHNLGVAPEMVWIKNVGSSQNWKVWHHNLGSGQGLVLNNANAYEGQGYISASSLPTSSNITIGVAGSETNTSSHYYIAYLFATLAGVSKVGSYTGTGNSNITVDCGFTSGARFVLIKRTDASGSWWIADSVRGLSSGNDALSELNATAAQITGYNMVEPHDSGFIVNGGANKDNSWNDSGGNYVFYAIA